VFNLRFAGQYFDQETGLNYNGYRDYDPQGDRYVESDSTGLQGGINTYAYVTGNPLSRTDEFGLGPRTFPEPGIPSLWPGGFTPGTKDFDDLSRALTGAFDRALDAIKEACTICAPCSPHPKGTIGYIGPHTDHDHFPIGLPHLNLFVVNQNPKTCKCFWNKATPAATAPPPHPDWVDLNGGFPPLSP
jgi:RHS repeat-associated protein